MSKKLTPAREMVPMIDNLIMRYREQVARYDTQLDCMKLKRELARGMVVDLETVKSVLENADGPDEL
jgi:hypothetical protein